LSLAQQEVKIQGYKHVAVARQGIFAGPFALLQTAVRLLGQATDRSTAVDGVWLGDGLLDKGFLL